MGGTLGPRLRGRGLLQSRSPMGRDVELSVVIACLNGAAHLDEQLCALARESPGSDWEVIVADNGSNDDSKDVCAARVGQLDLQVVDASDKRGQAHARNVGARASKGRKLVFLDQDDVIEPGYLAAVSRALDQHCAVAANMDYELLNAAWAMRARSHGVAGGLRPGLYPWAYGCTLGVRRDVFEAVGGFDEGLPAAEDVDLCWRIRHDTGHELHLVDGAVLHYRLKASAADLFRQGLLYGRGGASLYRKWRAFGMRRRTLVEASRAWAAVGWRLVASKDRGARAEAVYLLGNRVGCVMGSVAERVVFL